MWRWATVAVGVCLVTCLALGTRYAGWFKPNRAQAPPSGALAPGAVDSTVARSLADPVSAWSQGAFTRLAGRDIRRDLDRHLMLELKTDIPWAAESALREKLAGFLVAYGGTDFGAYLAFRDRATLCAAGDPRLRTAAEIVRQVWDESRGPVPTEPLELMEVLWALYVSEGFGPIPAGPIMEEVNWSTARATVRKLSKREIVLEEWQEDAGAESHLYKEYLASKRPQLSMGAFQKAIPNATSVTDILRRDGEVMFADFEIVFRVGQDPAHPLLVRFVWDAARQVWLPLHAIKPWSAGLKPFVW